MDLRSFKADWLKLRFMERNTGGLTLNASLKVKDASRSGRQVELLGLHGPWLATAVDEKAAAETGLDERTLTALFELDSSTTRRFLRATTDQSASSSAAPIGAIQVEYNNELNRRQDPLMNPIEFIQLDYLSSTDLR